jgi:hypothetical protein
MSSSVQFCMKLGCVLFVGVSVSGCAEQARYSQQQLAYNACANAHNSSFRFNSRPSALVSGVNANGSTGCFQTIGDSTTEQAIQRTLQYCRERMSNCFVFSTNSGLSDWVQRVSNAGGSDGSGQQAGTDTLQAATAVLGLVSAGLGAHQAFSGNAGLRPGGGGGVGANRTSTGAVPATNAVPVGTPWTPPNNWSSNREYMQLGTPR